MDAKALLDSLMGNDRNAGKKELQGGKAKRQNFWDDNVCKAFLIGDCTHEYFLNEEGKPVPKSPLGECPKQHSEAMKLRFQEDKDYDKWRYKYLKELEVKMKRLVDELNNKRDGERDKLCRGESDGQILMKNCTEASDTLVKEKMDMAEILGIRGDTAGSQALLAEASKIKAKAEKLVGGKNDDINYRKEDICEVCGTTIMREQGSGSKGFGTAEGHFQSSVCVGWASIRKSLKKYQTELKEAPKLEDPVVPKDENEDTKSKGRRDTDRDRRGGNDTKERGRETNSDRDRAGRDRDDRGDRGDRGGRERDDRGGRDRDRDRERDRESNRDRRNDRQEKKPEKKKEVRDEFGRSKVIATDYTQNPDKYKEEQRRQREARSRERKKEPEQDNDELKVFYISYSKDWEQVMNKKFASLRLEQDAWDLSAFDAKGDTFEMDDEEVKIGPDSFPLKFKFTRNTVADRSRSRSRGKDTTITNTDTLKIVKVPLTADWQEVMEEKFQGLRLEKDAWDMKTIDAKGKSINMNSEEVQLGPDSFPLTFKFIRR